MVKINIVDLEPLQALCQGILKFKDHPSVFHEKMEWLFSVYQPFEFSLSYGGGLWRAHHCSIDKFATCDWLWAPPPAHTKIGRLNAEGAPVLYASLHNRIALKELKAVKGDIVHVVKYDMFPEKRIQCCVVGEISDVYRTGRSWVSEELGAKINGILNSTHQKALATGDHTAISEAAAEANSWVYLDSFLAEVLRDKDAEANGYLLSSALASLLFERSTNSEAILYPSVPLASGKNIAIRLPAATSVLKLAHSSLIRVTACYEYGITAFEALRARSH